MNIRESILQDTSKGNILRIAQWVAEDKQRIKELIHLFLHDEYRVVQHSAWIISYVAQMKPGYISPYLKQMVGRMGDTGVPVAVKRNVLRILQFMPMPQSLHEPLINYCFEYITNEKETVAVRAFSMTVLANIVINYPDLKKELVLIIEDAMEHQELTAGFISRAKKTLAFLKKDGSL